MGKRGREWEAAGAIGAVAILTCIIGYWPFNAKPRVVTNVKSPSIAQFFLADRITLGFVRLAVAGLAIYFLASLGAFVVSGRWLKVLGKGGLEVEERQQAGLALGDLELQLTQALTERDDARKQLSDLRTTLRTALGEDTPEGE